MVVPAAMPASAMLVLACRAQRRVHAPFYQKLAVDSGVLAHRAPPSERARPDLALSDEVDYWMDVGHIHEAWRKTDSKSRRA